MSTRRGASKLSPEEAAERIDRAINRSKVPTSKELAAKISLSARQVNRIRAGERRLTHERATQIETACEIPNHLLHNIIDATSADAHDAHDAHDELTRMPTRGSRQKKEDVRPGDSPGASEPLTGKGVSTHGSFIGGNRRRMASVAAALFVAAAGIFWFGTGNNGHEETAAPTSTSVIYTETAGGPADVHQDYRSLAGVQTQAIGQGEAVQVQCRVRGVKVGPSQNPWWYRLASPRLEGRYATGDALYNNGRRSGSISDTPLVDQRVPECQ
jgi:DNA-binding transcriptional regulator YdaS (Cro superfamily)